MNDTYLSIVLVRQSALVSLSRARRPSSKLPDSEVVTVVELGLMGRITRAEMLSMSGRGTATVVLIGLNSY